MQTAIKVLLALDVGDKRIGIARARTDVRLASPLVTLANDEHIWQKLNDLVKEYEVNTLVIGLPRGLEGQSTAQTKSVQTFAEELKQQIPVKQVFQDEALTSVKAEAELAKRGKLYDKAEVDALAATYILEDFLNGPEASHV